MTRFVTLIGLAVVSGMAVARPDDPYTARAEKLDPPATLAAPVRGVLSKDALVVRRTGDAVVMRVWFRDPIAVKASPDQLRNGLTYREIPEGSLVGAIEFPQTFTDFRKQEIPAGVYTLRFAVQPDIGDHTGTAPHPDFCLMSPAAKDASPDAIEKKDLIELSSTVNEGKHPAVLLLFPYFGKDDGPRVAGKGDGVWVATTRRAVQAGGEKSTLGFAVTVAGMWKQ
jgi:hypothetical protein